MKNKYLFCGIILILWQAISLAEGETLISIDDAYRLALQSHENILVADIEVDKSELLPGKALTEILPHLDVSGDYSRPKEPVLLDTSPIIPAEKWTGTVTLTQKLYDPRLLPAYALGKHTTSAKKESYAFTVRNVLFNVAGVYYSILKNEDSVAIAKDTVLLAKEELMVAEEKYKAGEVPRTDVLRAELELSRAERQIVEAENSLLSSKALFANLLCFKAEEDYRLEKPKDAEIKAENLEDLLKIALEHRNDLKESSTNIEVAKINEKLVWAEFQPDLKLEWSDYWVDPETFSQKSGLWTMTVSASMPIFEGGLRAFNLKEKKMEIRQAQLNRERLKKEIETDVQNSYFELTTFKSVLSALEKEVELTKETYHITKERYLFGQASSIDIMDALNRYNSSRVEHSVKNYEYQLALLNVQLVTGTFAEEYINFPYVSMSTAKRGVK